MKGAHDIFRLARFWSKVEVGDVGECWPWRANKNSVGYGKFYSGERQVFAHRFACELVNGKTPVGMVVMHKCDNPPCCNPRHLLVGTYRDNAEDMVRKGRGNYVNNAKRKLTPEQVREIRASPEKGRDLAKKFGVAPSTVSMIRSFYRRQKDGGDGVDRTPVSAV
jgi:hypothetical protein